MALSPDVGSSRPPSSDPTANGDARERPPSYCPRERPPSYEDEFAKLSHLRHSESIELCDRSPPIPHDQCVAHLKFLAVLADLRDSISNSNGLFNLSDSQAEVFPGSFDEACARIREKRWAVYTARAVERYTKWWFTCLPASRPPVDLADLQDTQYEAKTIDCETSIPWTEDNLPPVDILMVWHSHMLNPRNFLEDCIRYGKMSFWRTGFPFNAINTCIDNHVLEYKVGDESQKTFEQQAQLKWDNLEDPSTKNVECPACGLTSAVPWTEGGIGTDLRAAFRRCRGYADASFKIPCRHCRQPIDHDRLKVAKFRKDLIALVEERRPMPGSICNIRGIPDGRTGTLAHRAMMFPSLFMVAAAQVLLDFTRRADWCVSINHLRIRLEPLLRDPDILQKAHGSIRGPLLEEKMQFRRMMSRYWDNSSPFALDLVGAVIRQGTFIQKMDYIDWLHSPTLWETVDRLITKYQVFFDIILRNTNNMAVPTLDVDLAWHTHQLQPRWYYQYSTQLLSEDGIRQFIDHDDKVDENDLSDAFEWTSMMYRRATGGAVYSECTCWYCEATRTPDLYNHIFSVGSASQARSVAKSLHDRADISSDPEKNSHISAHNAIRVTHRVAKGLDVGHLKRLRLRQNYEKAVRRTKKRAWTRPGGIMSSRDEIKPSYPTLRVWGNPLTVAFYGPYMCDPGINQDAYACNPTCMHASEGDVGNCCSGTCGATSSDGNVSLGAGCTWAPAWTG
ncbi:hypothetical protein BDV26DRAFT_254708 [Aspergillus bertholletiae]|uniref:Alpha-ketoglutarate-dependent sulfonate dioxygenase n=1 Tax=Aspergillus bertholletiae TaxID=1226010 RepID=A0A5N7BJ73_9EURO|nr:hypothetical protein BDV26DRAFT_254708 [Aspergillus bertholletiae]